MKSLTGERKLRNSSARIAGVMIAVLALILTACGNGNGDDAPEPAEAETEPEPAEAETEEGAEEPSDEQSSGEAPTAITIAGSQTTGTWFVFGGAICEVLTSEMDITCSATPSSGSGENIENLQDGRIAMGMSLPDSLYFASEGLNEFDSGPRDKVRAAFNTYSFPLHIIVREDSAIQTVEDLAGATVAVGPPGSTDIRTFESLLEAYPDLSTDDMNLRQLDLGDRAEQLRDGDVDALVAITGQSAAGIQELAATTDVRYIPVPEDTIAEINEAHPYLVAGTLPDDHVPGMDGEVSAIFTWGVMATNSDVDADFIYEVTRHVFENVEQISGTVPDAVELTPESAVDVPIELHEGARRYFEEVGVL